MIPCRSPGIFTTIFFIAKRPAGVSDENASVSTVHPKLESCDVMVRKRSVKTSSPLRGQRILGNLRNRYGSGCSHWLACGTGMVIRRIALAGSEPKQQQYAANRQHRSQTLAGLPAYFARHVSAPRFRRQPLLLAPDHYPGDRNADEV